MAFAVLFLLAPQLLMAVTKSTSTLSKKELHLLIKTAKTRQDHEKLGAYYRAEVQRYEAQRVEHEQMAREYAENPMSHRPTKWPDPALHCRDLVNIYTQAARDATALADYHEKLASTAAQEGLPEQSPK